MIFLPVLFLCCFLFLIVAARGFGKEPDNSLLSDLGGLYMADSSMMDFDAEISCLADESDGGLYAREIGILDAFSQGNFHDKIYGWGLRRKPGNVPPDADPGAPELLKKYKAVYIGDTSQKTIYLTFDEGYENGYTPKILDTLRDNGVQAAFFITGPYLKEHEELVRRMVEEGHTVGNHTIHHPSLPSLPDSEMQEEVLGLDRTFYEKFRIHMRYLRPPKGEYSERSLSVTSRLGYINVFWSFAYDDWHRDKHRGAEYAYNKVMDNLHNGAILLLHAVSRDNAEALDMIIKGVRQKGYRFGELGELADNLDLS